MDRRLIIILLSIGFCQLIVISLLAQVDLLPLIQIEDLEYQGGFIIPSEEYGESSANYTTGTIEYNSSNRSLFLAGFDLDGAIAEFAIPSLIKSTDLKELNTATILQNFKKLLNLSPDDNPQSIDRISGMRLINNKLMINALEYYDAPADNTHTTLVLENPNDISSSLLNGYHSLAGAAHSAGWISPIPAEWQALLGGDYLSGNSSRYPINGRQAIGISAFAFNSSALNSLNATNIPTTTLLDYDLTHPLYSDYEFYYDPNYNLLELAGETPPAHTFEVADAVVGTNDLWTEESQASYGYIVPGTRTYLTLGSSGGHNSGIGYKPTQDNGYECPGPCPYSADDYYNFYWLWDVNDLLEVKKGNLNPYEVRPYSYGVFDAPFQLDVYSGTPEFHPISGGTYDQESGLLYLSIYDGAPIESPYDRTPVIVGYKLNSTILSVTDQDILPVVLSPNPAKDYFEVGLKNGTLDKVLLFNELGHLITETGQGRVDVSDVRPGVYIVATILKSGTKVFNKLVIN